MASGMELVYAPVAHLPNHFDLVTGAGSQAGARFGPTFWLPPTSNNNNKCNHTTSNDIREQLLCRQQTRSRFAIIAAEEIPTSAHIPEWALQLIRGVHGANLLRSQP